MLPGARPKAGAILQKTCFRQGGETDRKKDLCLIRVGVVRVQDNKYSVVTFIYGWNISRLAFRAEYYR